MPRDTAAAVPDATFDAAKARVLEAIEGCVDNSKKGGLDAPILNLINAINAEVCTRADNGLLCCFSSVACVKLAFEREREREGGGQGRAERCLV